MNKPLLAALVLVLLSTRCAATGAAPLRLCYEDINQPPWSAPDGSGLNLVLLNKVAQQLDERFTYLPKPWKRCFEELHWGNVDGVIGAADAPDRREIGVLPRLADGRPDPSDALNEDTYYVFTRKGSGASWDGKRLTVPHGAVIVPRSYSAATRLRSQGYPVDEIIKTPEEAFRLMVDGKADVAVLFGRGSVELASSPRFSEHVEEAGTPYLTQPYFVMAGQSAYNRDPKRFDAIWKAIRDVRASPEYRKLEKNAAGQAVPLIGQR